MKHQLLARDLFHALERRGFGEVELFCKTGRSRHVEIGPHGRVVTSAEEEGWAVRCGNRRASFFAAGTGLPAADQPWPRPEGGPILLPAPAPGSPWEAPKHLDAPLTSENEALAILESMQRTLQRERPGTRILKAVIDDGSSRSELFNTRGVEVTTRQRAALMMIEAVGARPADSIARLSVVERDIRRIEPLAVARHLANVLAVLEEGRGPERLSGDAVLAPAVVIRVLAGLLPLFLDRRAPEIARGLGGRQGQLASGAVSIVDDGRLAAGVLAAPVDGEGMPTREAHLVEDGRFVQPLLSWRDACGKGQQRSGCMRRDSWREPPRLAPSHLFVVPDPERSVGGLVDAVREGFYLLEPRGSGHFDLATDRFTLPVCGFELQQGAAARPVKDLALHGSVGGLLRSIEAVGRDLSFQPIAGILGAPSVLARGVSVQALPSRITRDAAASP